MQRRAGLQARLRATGAAAQDTEVITAVLPDKQARKYHLPGLQLPLAGRAPGIVPGLLARITVRTAKHVDKALPNAAPVALDLEHASPQAFARAELFPAQGTTPGPGGLRA